jgi:hypothetical protein
LSLDYLVLQTAENDYYSPFFLRYSCHLSAKNKTAKMMTTAPTEMHIAMVFTDYPSVLPQLRLETVGLSPSTGALFLAVNVFAAIYANILNPFSPHVHEGAIFESANHFDRVAKAANHDATFAMAETVHAVNYVLLHESYPP